MNEELIEKVATACANNLSDNLWLRLDDAGKQEWRDRVAETIEEIWDQGYSVVPSEEIARLKEALRPFARVAIFDIGVDESDKDLFRPMSAKTAEAPLLTVGDFRRARAALNGDDK